MTIEEQIVTKIEAGLTPTFFEIENESHKHAGPSTTSHFRLVIVSTAFEGTRLIARHRKVNALLADELANHIHALAFAANSLGLQSVGFIRGEWTDDNQTLTDAKAWGMQLISLSREEYRLKNDIGFLDELKKQFPQALWIPEGGSNSAALQGVTELMGLIEQQLPDLDVLVAACGTGGTLAGLIAGANSTSAILGVPVLKGAAFLKKDIEQLLADADLSPGCAWGLDLDGHYGGYGKVKAEQKEHMRQLEAQYEILLEPVYTAKMWRRFDELVASGHFAKGTKVALLHSGGLQGRRGFNL